MLCRAFALDEYCSETSPEVFPVCLERMFQICLNVAAFAFLDFLYIGWSIAIVVERRYQTWLYLYSELLHLGAVKAEVLAAERAHSHELDLPFEQIHNHRELIEPELPENPSPEIHPVVILELSAFLKPYVAIEIILYVFAV